MATKKKDADKDVASQTYEVLSPLRVGDDEYAPNDTVDMKPGDAEELVDAGVLRATKVPASKQAN